MKTLDRYIIRELCVPFLIGTVAVVLMFQANALIFFMKTFAVSNIPTLAFFQLILYKTPDFIRQTMPIGMALASSLAISRITRESELTAMRSAGMAIRRILWPVGLFGLVVGAVNFWITERVYPQAEKKFAEVSQKAYLLGTSTEYKSNVTLRLQNSTAYFASVRRIEKDRLLIQDALLFEPEGSGRVSIYFAAEGIYDKGVMTFDNAELWRFRNGKCDGFVSKRLVIDETISLADLFAPQQQTDKTADELRAAIDEARKMGRDVTSLAIDYHSRFAIPVACFVFAVAGPVFAVMLGRSGGFVGVFLSMLLVMLYYNAFVISTQILGRNGWISPVVAVWLPNVIFFLFGLIGLRRLE